MQGLKLILISMLDATTDGEAHNATAASEPLTNIECKNRAITKVQNATITPAVKLEGKTQQNGSGKTLAHTRTIKKGV